MTRLVLNLHERASKGSLQVATKTSSLSIDGLPTLIFKSQATNTSMPVDRSFSTFRSGLGEAEVELQLSQMVPQRV